MYIKICFTKETLWFRLINFVRLLLQHFPTWLHYIFDWKIYFFASPIYACYSRDSINIWIVFYHYWLHYLLQKYMLYFTTLNMSQFYKNVNLQSQHDIFIFLPLDRSTNLFLKNFILSLRWVQWRNNLIFNKNGQNLFESLLLQIKLKINYNVYIKSITNLKIIFYLSFSSFY